VAEDTTDRRRVQVNIATASVVGVMLAVALALLLRNVFVAARTPILWTLGGLILTIVLLPVVDRLSRWMPRLLAAVLALLLLAGAYVLVGWRFVDDLSTEITRLQQELPQAAAELEADNQVLQDFGFADRVREFMDQLPDQTIGPEDAASTAVTYFVAGTLTLFLLLYTPRMIDAGFAQVDDVRRRRELRRFVLMALRNTRRYVLGSLAGMILFGVIVYVLCRLLELPAPAPLAVVAGLLSALPYFGVALGALPVLLLAAGLDGWEHAVVAGLVIGVLQVLQVQMWKRAIQPRSLYIGPAVMSIVGLIGFDLYGLGGLLFGTAIGVFLVALGDAAAGTAFFGGTPTAIVTTEGEPAEPEPPADDPPAPQPGSNAEPEHHPASGEGRVRPS
jgi:predicted PurR-regulated permease PerM